MPATITEIAPRAAEPNMAGNRALYLINAKYIGTPWPEPDPITGIYIGEFLLPTTSLVPAPEILKVAGTIENTLDLVEEPFKEKGSNAKRYTVSFAVAKNNPNLVLLENRYFIPERYVAVLVDNNGYALVLGWPTAPGRVERSAASGKNPATDRNDIQYQYSVEMNEAAPYYNSNSGIDSDPFNIVYP